VVPCDEDLNGTGGVDARDLARLLSVWGPCPACAEDLDHDGVVGPADLMKLFEAWGACP